MLTIAFKMTETGEVHIPGLNLIIQDLTGGDPIEYAYETVARELGHNQFTLQEEINVAGE